MIMTRIESTRTLLQQPGDKMPLHADAQGNDCCVDHHHRLLAIQDTMAVLSGKWKIQLLGSLSFKGKQRFSDLLRGINGIRAKMLSKELQELEANQLLTRTVKETKPLTVEYEITPYGRTLEKLIFEIVNWGVAHRERIMKSD
jgi:DNA-binding HxlR family transcriptional regulator